MSPEKPLVLGNQRLVFAEWSPNPKLITKGKFLPTPLETQPKRVWTLQHYNDQTKPPELPFRPAHLHNAFLEDCIHDWRWSKGVLHYYTRVMDCGVWLLLEY